MTVLRTLGLRALAVLAPPDHRDALVGDLLEEHALRAADSPARAGRWLWAQLAASVWPLAVSRLRRVERPRLALILAAALLAAAVVHAAEAAFWRELLTHVPRRAAHAPSWPWGVVFVAGQAAGGALAAFALARATRAPWPASAGPAPFAASPAPVRPRRVTDTPPVGPAPAPCDRPRLRRSRLTVHEQLRSARLTHPGGRP